MPSNVPSEIAAELDRRKINRSFKYVAADKGNWDSQTGDWNKYRGTMVSWIRVCSNGAGHPLVHKERFVLYSGKGFYKSYGFEPSAPGEYNQVIGYTPGNVFAGEDPEPHVIPNSLNVPSGEPYNFPIHVPPPEISKLEVTIQKELFRRAQFEWVCFSWKQLVYMTPYFLVPRITCMIEWGWNHYNVQSLVDLGDVSQMRSLWDNAYPLYTQNVIKSRGNYDVVYGIVSNFNWEIQGNKIICTTEITSKDRLYAGVSKEYAVSVNDTGDETKGIFKGLKDFLSNDDTIKNLKTLVTQTPVINKETLQLVKSDPHQSTWYDILNPMLTIGTPEQIGMRMPYVFGVFFGRAAKDYPDIGAPYANDFDKKLKENNPDPNYFWINMGMVVAILNYFSTYDSGGKNGKKLFEVDIQNSVIGGHLNLVSCDQRVLIPNSQSPKFLWGRAGIEDNTGTVLGPNPKIPYSYQVLNPLSVGDSIANKKLSSVMLQDPKNAFCYRDDLDIIINRNRYKFVKLGGGKSPLSSYAFPSKEDVNLPVSPRQLGAPIKVGGASGNKVEKFYSGLLSNIYISYQVLKDAVDDDSVSSYFDIYKSILNTVMAASDGFWNLELTEVENVMTIADRNYIGKFALQDGQGDNVYSFDYYDADSIIKSIKFRPALSDAQATRVIFGAVNNKDTKYTYLDKNDILDYVFKDAVIGIPQDKEQGDPQGDLQKRKDALSEQKDLLRTVQNINSANDDGSLQMSLKGEPPLIIKLVMPSQQLLRMMLNDGDYDNNVRYCAVQPNLILELTLQGIGGLRTFQYFLVKNLPEPYSDRNVIWRITDVHQSLEAGNWETLVRAQPLPLRGYIKSRLTGPLGPSAGNNGWFPDPKS